MKAEEEEMFGRESLIRMGRGRPSIESGAPQAKGKSVKEREREGEAFPSSLFRDKSE